MIDLDRLLALYPALSAIPRDQLEHDLGHVPVIDVGDGAALFREHQPCVGFPFVLDGQVRVARGSPGGRELELYRVQAGEVCIVSMACLLGSTPMTAHGSAAAPTRLALIGRSTLLGWTAYEPVRMFLLGLMAERMADLMALVEAVAFQRMDQRLAQCLLGRGRVIHATHQQLADELGTAREIVSRLLKRFEAEQWVQLGRERIEVVDAQAIRAISVGEPPPGEPS